MYVVLYTKEARVAWLKDFLSLPVSKEKPIRISIEFGPEPQKRSLPQNDIFHTWCHIIADYSGHTADETKEFLKDMFIKPKVVEVGGKSRLIRPGSSSLSKEDMSAFLDRVDAWAATDLQIALPRREQ